MNTNFMWSIYLIFSQLSGSFYQKSIAKLLRIYLTIPVTALTAERNISALQRIIKTFLSSSMSQTPLNHCIGLHVLKDRTDKLDNNEIAREFIKRNEQYRDYNILDSYISQCMHACFYFQIIIC